jgi:biopolymer transport protein ExbD
MQEMLMAISAAPPSSPMDEINMTPLIDVMLVLLVMFIITIPLQTHAVKLDLPKACPSCPDVNEVKNRVVVTNGGAILWNGTPVNRDQLAFNLAASTRKSPQPELHLQPESEARYEIVNEVFVVARSAGVTRMGFVGNEAYRSF